MKTKFNEYLTKLRKSRVYTQAQMAEKLGISSRQLERLYQEEFSMTPYQYFQQQKLALAKQYLSNTPDSVK